MTEAADELRILTAGTTDVLPSDGLREKLATARRENRPLRVKLGIDSSKPDLTLGHAVVLRKLREFQDLGHTAVLVIGDFTGQVGDPSDRQAARTMVSASETAQNSASYFDQAGRILDLTSGRCEVRRNSEWLGAMSMIDVLAQTQHLTVGGLLEREDFARRYDTGKPIALVEFLYPLLQGIDSVVVRADVELGGTDQTYNNLVGRTLQRADGQQPQVVVTLPLLEGLDGVVKMSKSLGNYVGIAEPATEQFGKLMSLPDPMVGRYAQLAARLDPPTVAELTAAASGGGPAAGVAKRAMARAVVGLYHGPDAAVEAEAAFDLAFVWREPPTDVPEATLPDGDPLHLPAVLVGAGLAASRSEARRLLTAGAGRLDGDPVAPEPLDLPRSALAGRVLQVGRRHAVRLGQ